MPKKIESIWAFLSEDEDGNEGIYAQKVGDMWMPFVGSNKENLETSRLIIHMFGKKAKLVRFSVRTEEQ